MNEEKTEGIEARVETVTARLRARGYRVTPQRMALIELLCESDGHPSASQLHERLRKRFPTTSLATVYKTLNVLKEIGEVTEIGFAGRDARYDGSDPNPHPHLICVQCRRIEDLDPEGSRPEGWVEAIAEASGYLVLSYRMDVYGLCPECQNRSEEAATES